MMPPTSLQVDQFEVNGVHIPAIGLGTFQGDNGNDEVKHVVTKALERGYRHIDTAWSYGNEKAVGEAIRESGIKRDELFVTTKLYTNHTPHFRPKISPSPKSTPYFGVWRIFRRHY